jgi:hypothetical protein
MTVAQCKFIIENRERMTNKEIAAILTRVSGEIITERAVNRIIHEDEEFNIHDNPPERKRSKYDKI